MIKKLKNIIRLLRSVDLEQLEKVAKKVDLVAVMQVVSKVGDAQLNGVMKMSTSTGKKRETPPVNADFYEVEAKLSPEDRALQLKVRDFLEREVKPVVNKYWLHDE